MVTADGACCADVMNSAYNSSKHMKVCVSVNCELGAYCALTGLCCVLNDVLQYKDEPLTVEPLF